MVWFRKHSATTTPPVAVSPARTLWSSGFGRLATRSLQIIIVVLLAAAAIWALRSLTIVVIPIMLAVILASAFAPVMHWMRARGLPDALATVLALLAILVILGVIGWLIVWAVSDQWDELAVQARAGMDDVIAWVGTLPFAPSAEQLDQWRTALIDFLTSAEFGLGALAGVSALARFVTGFILMVTVLFFFLKDAERIWAFLIRPFRDDAYARAQRIGRHTVTTLGDYIRGTAIIALVDAIGIGVGLAILQVPLALPLAALVFLLAFIPFVGATLAGTVAALVALVSNGPINAILVVALVVLVNQLEGNFLQPVVMGRTLKLHPLVILIALTVGTVLGGVLGAVLAVPITAVAWGAVQVWDGEGHPPRWARPRPNVAAPHP